MDYLNCPTSPTSPTRLSPSPFVAAQVDRPYPRLVPVVGPRLGLLRNGGHGMPRDPRRMASRTLVDLVDEI